MGVEGVNESLEASNVSSHDSGLQTKMLKYQASTFQTLRLHMCSNSSYPLTLELSTRTRKPHAPQARM